MTARVFWATGIKVWKGAAGLDVKGFGKPFANSPESPAPSGCFEIHI